MKKAFCLILVVALVAMLCGCCRKAGENFTETERFTIVSGNNPNAPYFETIIVDEETGVMYLAVYSGNQFGITPLLDSDGKPILWEEN